MKKFLERFNALPKWVQWMPVVIVLLSSLLIGAVVDMKKVQEKPVYTLGMTIEQFVQNLNGKQSQFSIQNSQLVSKNDGFLYLNHQFDNNAMLLGVVNENGHSIQSITVISTISGKDGMAQIMAAMNIPLLTSLTIQALNPTIDKNNIGPAVMNLFESATTKPDQMHHLVLNGNDYAIALSSADKAYVFSAVPTNLPQKK